MDAKDFVSIRVSTLRGDLKIEFDTYVKVAGKHILYLRKGDSFEGARLKRLKEKKLRKMYIKAEKETEYRKYMSQNIEMAYSNDPTRPIETRAEIIQGVQQAAAEDVMENPDVEAFYNVAKDGSQRFADFIKKEQQALQSLLQISNQDQSISHHGVTVATIATGLADKLGMTESFPINLMVMGALIHDIEHQHAPVPLSTPLKEMSIEDTAVYELHPLSGAKRVKDLNFYDQAVMNIILQHEEFINGSGFPRGSNENEQDALSILVSTANSYDRLVSFFGMPPKEALKTLLIQNMGLHPLPHLQSLQTVLKESGILL